MKFLIVLFGVIAASLAAPQFYGQQPVFGGSAGAANAAASTQSFNQGGGFGQPGGFGGHPGGFGGFGGSPYGGGFGGQQFSGSAANGLFKN